MSNEEKVPLKSVERVSPEADGKTTENTVRGPGRLKRGIYLLPNVITTGALFAGFYAIVAAMNGQFFASNHRNIFCHDIRHRRWSSRSDYGH